MLKLLGLTPIGIIGAGLAVALWFFIFEPGYAFTDSTAFGWRTVTGTQEILSADVSPPSFNGTPLLSPSDGATVTTSRPALDWDDAIDDVGVVSYTLRISSDTVFSGLSAQATTVEITTPNSSYTPTQILPNAVYTWTVQAHDAAGNVSGFVSPSYTFTVQAASQLFLPIIVSNPTPACPTFSNANFEIIPINGSPTDRPDYLHGDLNLALRGYAETNAAKTLLDLNGSTDPNAPQLAGLFGPNQFPGIASVYQVNQWDWGCGTQGCPAGPITDPEVSLMSLTTTPGQFIYIPERSPDIYGGGYKAMVLYAEERRVTLGYTRQDSVAPGYAVHIENVCVDPNLLALYQAQVGADGFRVFKNGAYWLPALRNDQALGTALGSEIQVAIRDRGSFMEPRSRKDWWVGY